MGKSKDTAAMPPKRMIDKTTYLGRVAVRLHMLRTAAGLSVDDLSKRLLKVGAVVKPSTIYSWEQARSTPHVELLPALAKVYKLARTNDVLPDK